MTPDIYIHKNDLPPGVAFGDIIAVDTESMGLNPHCNPLCMVQLSSGDGTCHLVQLDRETYEAPNLKALLSDSKVTKIFHFARADVAMIYRYLDILCQPIYCTKIASKLVRTYTQRHGLKHLCHDLLEVDISKDQQTSDWGRKELSKAQQLYAATDVLYLHQLKAKLDSLLKRENRQKIAGACFAFIPDRAQLDLLGFETPDIFEH